MKNQLISILSIASFSLMLGACDSRGGSSASTSNKSNPSKPTPPDSVNQWASNLVLNKNGVNIDIKSYVEAYPVGRDSAGSVVYQLRFFDQGFVGSCDRDFRATESSSYSHFAMMVLPAKVGAYSIVNGNWNQPGVVLSSEKPFNTIYKHEGTVSVDQVNDFRIRGHIQSAVGHGLNESLTGSFEAYLCGQEAKAISNMSLREGSQNLVLQSRSAQTPVSFSVQVQSSGISTELLFSFSRAAGDLAQDVNTLKLRVSVVADNLISLCQQNGTYGPEVIGKISDEGLVVGPLSPGCQQGDPRYYPTIVSFRYNVENSRSSINLTTRSGHEYWADLK